jgi:hypothetical protein
VRARGALGGGTRLGRGAGRTLASGGQGSEREIDRPPGGARRRGQRQQEARQRAGARRGPVARAARERGHELLGVLERQAIGAALRQARDLLEQLEGRQRSGLAGQEQLAGHGLREHQMDALEILEVQLAGQVQLGHGLGQHVLDRVACEQSTAQRLARRFAAQRLAPRHARRQCRARRLPARLGQQPAQVVTRHDHRPLALERLRQAQVDQLVVDQLADERGRDALEAAVEDALLHARRDLLGGGARQVGFGHQRHDDAALAPGRHAARELHARRNPLGRTAGARTGSGRPAVAGRRGPHLQGRADARAPVAVQDVGLGHGRVPELDQRLLDQVLDLLDAGRASRSPPPLGCA